MTDVSAEQTLAALQEAAPAGRQVPGGRTPGGLKRSIRFDLAGTTATFTASQVAEFVIGGTEAHEITGKGGPLHFYWEREGDWFTFMRVHHPGTKPNDFRVPAVDAAGDQADVLLEDLADSLFARLGS